MDKKVNELTRLEVRGMITRAVNAGIQAGLSPLEVAMTLDSIKADLLLQASYQALAEQEEENRAATAAAQDTIVAQESTESGETD